MSLGLSTCARNHFVSSQKLSLELSQLVGETIGDIPLLSLHRIKNRIDKRYYGLNVSYDIKLNLISNLLLANQDYRNETGRNWNCITANGLETSVIKTKDYILEKTDIAISRVDGKNRLENIKSSLYDKTELINSSIKRWFHQNYENLIYNMDGKIPWPVIRKLRDELGKWCIDNINPFGKSNYDLIEETIVWLGLDPKNYSNHDDMWRELQKNRP